jgi:hypothetical protein
MLKLLILIVYYFSLLLGVSWGILRELPRESTGDGIERLQEYPMMKHKLFVLISLPLVILATACGSSNDQPAVDTSAVQATAANSCQSGYVYNPSYGCLPAQYGQPPGYNGQPVNVTIPSNGYCNGGGSYYGGNRCFNQGTGYTWRYYGGYYYYW